MKVEKEISICKDIIHHHFGQRCQILEYGVLLRKTDYFVADLTLSNSSQRVVLKLAGPKAPITSPFDRTFAINQQIRQQSTIPTYEAIAFDMSYGVVPYRYLLMTHVAGHVWANIRNKVAPEEFQSVYRDFGRIRNAGYCFNCFGAWNMQIHRRSIIRTQREFAGN